MTERKLSPLAVKTGVMIDGDDHIPNILNEHWDDFVTAFLNLPRACEVGLSGAAGYYGLFEYDNLAEANKWNVYDASVTLNLVEEYAMLEPEDD